MTDQTGRIAWDDAAEDRRQEQGAGSWDATTTGDVSSAYQSDANSPQQSITNSVIIEGDTRGYWSWSKLPDLDD